MVSSRDYATMYDATSTYCPDDTTVWSLTFTSEGCVSIKKGDPVRHHERETGIRAALRYLASKGKPWRGCLP